MASTHKHIRSGTANKRPTTAIAEGQIALATNITSPGLFFKDSTGATIVKIGPVHVGATAPNVSPAGSAGNSIGEVWLDTSLTPVGVKIWDGSAFVNATPIGSTTVQGLLELATDAETQAGADTARAVTSASLQSKLSDSTSTTSNTTIASSTAVKAAYDLANAALPKTGGTVTGNLEIGTAGSLSFEGATADGFETTIAITDPTADRTITLPNITGTVVTTGDSGTVTSTMILDGTIVDADINASAEISVSKLVDGSARQLLQTDAAGTGVEWASNIDIPGTLDVTSAATFDSSVAVTGALTKSGSNVVTVGDTGTVTSTMILDGTILNADVNASAAIAGTKISPDFGAQTIVTTGVHSAALGAAATPSITFTGDLNTGIYSPGADQVAVATNGVERVEFGTTEVVFNDGGENYDFRIESDTNANLFFVDASNNAIGIGNTSPAYALDIASTDTTAGIGYALRLRQNATAGATAIQFSDNPVTTQYGYIASDSSSNLKFATGLTEKVRITSAGLVGIGTTSPGFLLDVAGSARLGAATGDVALEVGAGASANRNAVIDFVGDTTYTDYGLRIIRTSSGANADSKIQHRGTGALIIEAQDAASTTFFNGGYDRARIDSDGRLLVGTSSALATAFGSISPRFQVATTTSGPVSFLSYANDAFGARIDLCKSRAATVGTNTVVQSNDDLGEIYFNGADGTNLIPAALIRVEVDGTVGANRMPGRLAFSTATDASPSVVTERMRITSAGLVGIGTTSPGVPLEVNGTIYSKVSTSGDAAFGAFNSIASVFLLQQSDKAQIYTGAAQPIVFTNNNTERARIDSSGRLLVGTSTSRSNWANLTGTDPNFQIEVNGNARASISRTSANEFGPQFWFGKTRGTAYEVLSNNDQLGEISFMGADGTELVSAASITAFVDGTPGANDMPGRLVFSTTADGASSPTERMRITSGGYFKASNAGTYGGVAGTYHELRNNVGSGALVLQMANTSATGNGVQIDINSDGTSYAYLVGYSTSAAANRIIIWSNGNVVNTNNSYGAISDIKLKENIVDANSQWDDLKALQVRNYNFKEGQTHTQIGLVAQEVELVSPGLVTESPDRDEDGNDLGTVTKSVNYSVLYMKAVKALQEAMERIETLEQRLNDAGIN